MVIYCTNKRKINMISLDVFLNLQLSIYKPISYKFVNKSDKALTVE